MSILEKQNPVDKSGNLWHAVIVDIINIKIAERNLLMSDYFYKVVVEPQPEGGFTAYVPGLPGCVSEGETYRETMDNIREAMELYLEVKKERDGEIVPDNIHITEMCVSL